MGDSRKIEEGREMEAQAEKSLKTGLLKWRPDYDVAADFYMKASTAYRIAKCHTQNQECLMKAIDCYKNNKSWYHAAKCYEQIVILKKETNNLTDIEEFANKASSLYQQHGSPEAASTALDKAAKVIEKEYPEVALRLFEHALDIAKTEDTLCRAHEYASKVSRLSVKLNMYDKAADSIRHEIGLYQQSESSGQIGRLAVCLVLVQLGRGDVVAAEKSYKEWGNYCENEESRTMELLLQALDDEDTDNIIYALNSPFIKHMDVEYALLARKLTPQKRNPIAAEGNSSSSGNPKNSEFVPEDDDDDNNLC